MPNPRGRALQGLLTFAISASIISMYSGLEAQRGEAPQVQPFKGMTANGTIEAGLFPIKATGVSTRPVREAAQRFLQALTDEQRSKTTYAVDDEEWLKWNNVHRYTRQGVNFKEMTEAQRERAFAMMRAGLSAKGFERSRNVMRLNGYIAELLNRPEEYGEWLYHLTVMGTPSDTGPWGWQLDGHHLVINYFVLGDQVVMTPTFMGSEPVTATSGTYKGTTVLQDEQRKGLALINALDEAQRQKAIIAVSKTGNHTVGEAFKDNVVLDDAGIRAAELTAQQKEQLLDLIGEYVRNMRDGHAQMKMDEVRRHLDETRFAWIGETGPNSVLYYRIHSPVVLIE